MSSATPGARFGIVLLLRRLRLPLSVLIGAYAVAVVGFTLLPGVDPDGQPWRMSFLHAFYFVSFLGTTIGLGEIPYPFSDIQRMWATASIYATVLAWLYAIGALFGVLQDPLFRRIVHQSRIERAVRRLDMPFYLICGYDDAGTRVARELAEDGSRFVVIDADQDRVDSVEIDPLPASVPALCADASDPKSLIAVGLTHPNCVAVLALTGSDFINIKIALTARLLHPDMPVLCAARDHAAHGRMAAAGAQQIINPFDVFAERVALSMRTPSLHVIYEALTTQGGTAMQEVPQLPRGRWILCGSGLFTRTLRRQLERLDIETTVIAPENDSAIADEEFIEGDPTDPAVLERANLSEATALVAGTAVDIDNLTIVLAARSQNKRLFITARQTQRRNTGVFHAAPTDLVMLSGYIIAAEVLRVIRAPQLATFLRQARNEDEDWAAALLARMREVIGDEIVESWSVELVPATAPTICILLAQGEIFTPRRLMTRNDGSGSLVHAIPLLLQRDNQRDLLPALDDELIAGDRILFCGRSQARDIMRFGLIARHLPEWRSTLISRYDTVSPPAPQLAGQPGTDKR
ncbi:potassium channel family protein [Piscinibacter sakaiensis]|uniref:potassium channel family protein n=1 Tax=Piscinibacter sakaiensis TaxID=1547922 RepID=UPI003AAA8093